MRRAILLSLSLLAAELGLVVLAIWGLVHPPRLTSAVNMGLALGCFFGAAVVLAALSARYVGGLRRLIEHRRKRPAVPGLAPLHDLRRSLATQAALGCLVVAASAAVFASLLAQLTRWTAMGIAASVAAATSAAAVVEMWRPALLGRLLGELAGGRRETGGSRWQRQTLTWDLLWTGVATGAAGMLAVALFIRFFIPLRLSLRHLLVAYFPATILAVAGLWLLASFRLMRPLRRYLVARSRGSTATEPKLAVHAYRAVQVLPYTLAGAKICAFLLAGLLLFVEGVWLFGLDRESAVLMTGATALSSFAAALYEAFWHRATLRPVLAELAATHRLDIAEVRSPLSVRVKMFAGFGMVLFFACAISIFWSFLQVRNLAVEFVQKQSSLKAEHLVDRLRTQDKISGPVQPTDVVGLLGQLAGAGEEVYWYLPPSGPAERFGSPDRRIPSLPFVVRTRMRRTQGGVLRLGNLGLAGAYMRIHVRGRDLGSVAVLYPEQTRRGAMPRPQTAVLALFFLVLFGLCTGIVALIAADLSAPLRALEKRAGEMAQGELRRPVVTGAEADEVGRLAFALDDMRRSLEEQIRTVEELNVSLEEKVAQRTSDLARANDDLREALDSLTSAQDRLVRSEKLASIGQLVAGVAHELNNPVNAVFNCIGPLESSLRTLGSLYGLGSVGSGSSPEPTEDTGDMRLSATVAPGDPGDKAIAELTEDAQGMLRVIRSGAERIQRIVSALSSYARPGGEDAAPVDLNAIVNETLDLAVALLAEVQVVRDLDVLPAVTGHAGQLGQVLMNLVANAAQAVAGLEDARITVRTRHLGDRVEVRVSDNGPGVPEGLRARIFDPFFTTKDVGKGTGLGLSISHEIVVGHGGTLELCASEPRGATFVVSLRAGSEPPSAEDGTGPIASSSASGGDAQAG